MCWFGFAGARGLLSPPGTQERQGWEPSPLRAAGDDREIRGGGPAGTLLSPTWTGASVPCLGISIFNHPGTFRNVHTGDHKTGEVNEDL